MLHLFGNVVFMHIVFSHAFVIHFLVSEPFYYVVLSFYFWHKFKIAAVGKSAPLGML